MKPTIENLEGLIRADNYFNSIRKAIVKEETLLEYIQNTKPALSIQDIKALINATNNQLLQKSFQKYIDNLNEKYTQFQSTLQFNHRILANIEFDKSTAFYFCQQMFQIKIQRYGNQDDIELENFNGPIQNYYKIWQASGYDMNQNNKISLLLPLLEYYNPKNFRPRNATCLPRTRQLLINILETTAKDIINGKLKIITKLKQQINVANILITYCRLHYEFNERIEKCNTLLYDDILQFASIEDCKTFMKWICHTHSHDVDTYLHYHYNGQEAIKQYKALTEYIEMFKSLLLKLQNETRFILETADVWFHMLYFEDPTDHNNWILKNLFNPKNVNTHLMADIAMFLISYLPTKCEFKREFPIEFQNICKEYAGIGWKVLIENQH